MLTNPALVFCYIWCAVLLLYVQGWSDLLTPLLPETVYLIVASSGFFLMGYFFLALRPGLRFSFATSVDRHAYLGMLSERKFKTRFLILLIFWLCGSVFEVIYHKNLPLFSAFGFGVPIRYTEFGLPVFHGFLNAAYFLIAFICFIKAFLEKSKTSLFMLLFLFVWPALILSRMMMVALVLQLSFTYLILARPPWWRLTKFFLIGMLSLFIFGILGDLRSGRDMIIRLAQLNFAYPDWAPSFPVWVYVYLVSPINNVNYNIIEADAVAVPFFTLSQLLPSPLRNYLSAQLVGALEFDLVSSALNVNTIFYPLLADFGYIFAPFVFFIVGCGAAIVIARSRSSPAFLVAWVVLLYAVVESVFSNHMLHLVFIFEFIFALFVFRRRAICVMPRKVDAML